MRLFWKSNHCIPLILFDKLIFCVQHMFQSNNSLSFPLCENLFIWCSFPVHGFRIFIYPTVSLFVNTKEEKKLFWKIISERRIELFILIMSFSPPFDCLQENITHNTYPLKEAEKRSAFFIKCIENVCIWRTHPKLCY